MKTKRLKKNMKGCGKGCSKRCNKCKKSRCSHKNKRQNGGCGTCQSGGNVIYTPATSMAGTVLTAGINVFRSFSGLIPL
jgi:hypothetical protein